MSATLHSSSKTGVNALMLPPAYALAVFLVALSGPPILLVGRAGPSLSLGGAALAHGPAEWIERGGYTNAVGQLCCGERDCA